MQETVSVKQVVEKTRQEFLKSNELQEFEVKTQSIEKRVKSMAITQINQEYKRLRLKWIQEIEWALN